MQARTDLQSVLHQHLADYRKHHTLSARERQVCAHVTGCRTPLLGGQLMRCDECNYSPPQYYSCRDRHCPKCQHQQREVWCERQRANVVPVHYHHIVFTLPSELNGWVSLHPEILYKLLFACAWGALSGFGADPKRLNGQLGMIAVLHTWGENMSRHVHLHCLVPGGVLDANKQWATARGTYLFPVRALSRGFRGRFVSALRHAQNEGQLDRVKRVGEVDRLLNELMSKDWVIYSKPCEERTTSVIDYLGRYSYRIAISDQRIIAIDDKRVHFSYKDYTQNAKRRVMALDASEFIRRYLLHVLPKGLMRIRHYGWLANRCRKNNLVQIRHCLQVAASEAAKKAEEPTLATSAKHDTSRCPKCKVGCLQSAGFIEPSHLAQLRRLTEG